MARQAQRLHAQCFVNSIAHMNPVEDPVAGSARNIGWLALIHNFQGENWHANHHAKPSSARLGWTWKQPDLGWWLIVGLRSVGLARNVRGVRPARPAVSSTTSSSQGT